MRILLTGASGFIGGHIAAALIAAGHRLVCAVRDVERAGRIFPGHDVIACDFNRDTAPAAWLPRLAGMDAVINCAGLLRSGRGQSIAAVHAEAPKALFDACVMAGIRRVIQISALGVAPGVDTDYARTKLAADRHLERLDLDWLILRPSLAYTPAGSYGGTSLFRALAALPWIIPLVGEGRQPFQPIHMDDLAEAVRRLVESPAISRQIIDVAGPERIELRDILIELRRWLGLPPARLLVAPLPLIRLVARAADRLRIGGPINSTSLAMLELGNVADPSLFTAATRIAPRRFAEALAAAPSHIQDRWHARLYFLRPVLRVTIGLFWISTGLITLVAWPKADSFAMLRAAGVPDVLVPVAFHLGWAFDVLLGYAMVMRENVRLVGSIMLVATVAYLAFVTKSQPWQWLHPVTPLAIVIPLMVATLVVMAIEDDR